MIRGDISIDTGDLGDFIIAKSPTEPIFHLTVVADDYEMGITHVIRGEDHVSNTPRQILIQQAIGAPMPFYAHLPLVLSPDRSKLSKRKGALSMTEYRNRGYLPEALLNYMALLGWNPGTDEEIFSRQDLIDKFNLGKIQKGAAIFDETKLNWINREHLKRLTPEQFLELARPYLNVNGEIANYSDEQFIKALPLALDHISTLSDLTDMRDSGDLDYYFNAPKYDFKLLKTTEFLPETGQLIKAVPDDKFDAENIKLSLWDFATEKGRGQVLWPLRVALTGKEKSPDPFSVAAVIGKAETLQRIANAINLSKAK